MAKLPDSTAFGALGSPHSGRQASSIDQSGFARGGAAIAAGAKDIGTGLGQAGRAVADVAIAQANEDDTLDYAKAKSDFLTRKIALDSEFAADQDYVSAEKRYTDKLTEIRTGAQKLIRNTALHEKWDAEVDPLAQQAVSNAQARVRTLEGSANRAYVEQQGNRFIDQAVATDDVAERQRIIDAQHDLIDGAARKGYYNPEQALNAKQAWAKQYSVAGLMARIDRDPEGVINELRAAPDSGEGITNRIVQVEKGAQPDARNPNSSAMGDGQFVKGTWLDLIRRKRPDLADGRSDDDLLKLRADPQLSRQMVEAYRAENETYLKGQGLQATPGQQYLAHFLGPRTAAAVLKADPNAPIADVLAKAVGEQKAAEIVKANASVLDGRLAGSVATWADGKMGGAAPNGRQIYDILPPADRAQLLNQAQTKLAQKRATDLSGFQQRVEDTVTEARRNGTVASPLSEHEFIGKLGAEKGARAFAEYEAELQNGADVRDVANMDPATQAALLTRNIPAPGSEGFARQAKRQDSIQAAIARVNKEKAEDPAAFAITRLPVVNEAYATFTATVGDPTASPAMKAAAARDYAMKMEMEQARVGIAPTDRTLVPKAYIQSLNDKLSQPQKAGGTLNVAAVLKQEADLWGENWPKVYRELSKDAEPVVRVIGSGVTPIAAQLLVELKGMNAGEILKDQSDERMSSLRSAVREAFQPFARSLSGNEGANKVLNDFEGQALKLTAYWTATGASPEAAAAKAYDQLLGHKYEFGSSWRVPRDSGVTADQVKNGLAIAQQDLGKLNIAPARDTVGGLSADYLQRETLRAVRRDGVWVTSPDESGLALIYNDQAVRRRDGSPVILTWPELQSMGKTFKTPGVMMTGRILG